MPPKDIDAISVSIKAYTNVIHIDYTGVSNTSVLRNFIRIHKIGIEVDASSVFIPEYIDSDEVEKIAKFIASVDPNIPYHIIGYVPVPGTPWRGPRQEEVKRAAQIARKYLSNVTFSCLSSDEFLDLREVDPRYRSVRVA
jgi:pyruvate formate lyase activating enzyme